MGGMMNAAAANVASYGKVSVMGRIRTMKDTMTVAPNLINLTLGRNNEPICYDFFGVYDGHGSSRVSKRCKASLHNFLVDEIRDEITRKMEEVDCEIDWKRVMDKTFERMEHEAYRRVVIDPEEVDQVNEEEDFDIQAGSTAIAVMVGKEDLVVANCGNCRAVLGRGGVVIPLSRDHTLEDAEERIRVENAGADLLITWEGDHPIAPAPTSRIIGDHYLKQYITWEPEVRVFQREISDEFLIIASDGLWNTVSSDEAYEVVKICFNKRSILGPDWPGTATSTLAGLAISLGSKDNITVFVGELRPPANTSDTLSPT